MAEDYWIKRERDHINKSIKDDKLIAKKIKDNYERSLNEITKEIDAFYSRYAGKEGISMSEAIQKVAESDTKSFASKAKQYVKEKNFSDEANSSLRLYNATMRINRLEMLKANIGLELTAMSNEESIITRSALQKNVYDEFERQAGILGETVLNNQKTVTSIVNASFQNATFSQRIWSNHDALKSDLDKLLSRGMIQGKNPRVLAREIKKTFDVSLNQAERLMITEMARVQTAAQESAFKEYGYDQYIYIAEPTACSICKPKDGKVFNVKDMMPGVNASPMHPHCKCSTAAYIDRTAWEKQMDEREQKETASPEITINNQITSELTKEQSVFYNETLNKGPENARKVWDKYGDTLKLSSIDTKGAHYRSGVGVHMDVKSDVGGSKFYKPGDTFFHEFGHHINHSSTEGWGKFSTANTKLSNGKTLGETINEEIQQHIKNTPGKAMVAKTDLHNRLREDFDKDPKSMASISDLFGGATNNQMKVVVGHDSSYWKPRKSLNVKQDNKKYKNDMLGNEGFAEMFASDFVNPEGTEQFKKWLPESYNVYQELLLKLLE